MTRQERRRDFNLGLGVAAFGAALVLLIIPQGVVVPKGVRSAVLSPSFWPYAIAGFLLLGGILLAVQSRLASAGAPDVEGDEGEEERQAEPWLRLAASVVLLSLYYLAVQPLGMVVASMLAVLAFGTLAGATRRPIWLVVTALVLPLLLYGFFYEVASLPVPTGRWIHFP
ncbi:MAG: tripartite tricarboxylate transporter TctB family protein [Geminicoccaceae bacterium]|nr:tripartite tricarboxylate transporter TctB family protein [Geminicoccaceae bacterium]